MAYRNGTYIAFDGLGKADPSQSDYKYYATIQAWDENKDIDFQFTNSHDKSNAVKDTSKVETLKKAINTRLSNSKNMLVILSSKTRKSGSFLSYEIERAVDCYKIPLIIAYVESDHIKDPDLWKDYWPTSLEERINNQKAHAIHIPFRKKAIFTAIQHFNINSMPDGSLVYYNVENGYWDK